MRTFFHKLESAVCYGNAEKDAVSQATDMFKGVQNETKKVWAKHFDALTKKTRGTLEIVRSIDPEKVMKCLKLIQDAEVWTMETSVYKGYKRDKIEMRGDRAEISDFPLYLNTVAGGLDCRDQTISGFSFVVKIYTVPVVEIIG